MLYPIVALVVLILDIIAIVKVLGGRGSTERKLLWTIIIIVLPFIGMILYFLMGESAADA